MFFTNKKAKVGNQLLLLNNKDNYYSQENFISIYNSTIF